MDQLWGLNRLIPVDFTKIFRPIGPKKAAFFFFLKEKKIKRNFEVISLFLRVIWGRGLESS